jgi:hypothetical protein
MLGISLKSSSPVENFNAGKLAATAGDARRAQRCFAKAVKQDPLLLEDVLGCSYESPRLELSKTFLKKALQDPNIQRDPQRCSRLAWELGFVREALGRTSDYQALFNDRAAAVSPDELLKQYRSSAPAAARGHVSAQGCINALRIDFLQAPYHDVKRSGYGPLDTSIGAEQAALHGVLADVLGPSDEVVAALAPAVCSRALLAALRWGDTRGVQRLLAAGAPVSPVSYDKQTVELLLAPAPFDTFKRLGWLGMDANVRTEEKQVFVDKQNSDNLDMLLDHGLDVELVAAVMMELPVLDATLLENLLKRGLNPDFCHPGTSETFLQRALYQSNDTVRQLLLNHHASTQKVLAAVAQDLTHPA